VTGKMDSDEHQRW